MSAPKLCGYEWTDGWGSHSCDRQVNERGEHVTVVTKDGAVKRLPVPGSDHMCVCDQMARDDRT